MSIRQWLRGLIPPAAARPAARRRRRVASIGGSSPEEATRQRTAWLTSDLRRRAASSTTTRTMTMNDDQLQQLQSEGRSPGEITVIIEATEAMERRHEQAIEARAADRRAAALEDQKWERQRQWERQQHLLDPQASAQARRAGQ